MIDNLEDGFSDLRIGIAYISHHLYLDLHNLKGARDRQEDRTTNPQNIRASLKVVLTLKLNLNLFLHFQLLCIEKENSSFEQLLCWGIRKGKKTQKILCLIVLISNLDGDVEFCCSAFSVRSERVAYH